MYRIADDLHDGEVLRGYDVCIIGAGAAGIAMAMRLIDSGLNVLVLESGLREECERPSDVRQSIYGGSLGSFMAKVDPNFLTRSRLRMYGGTTNHFAFCARPLDDTDLAPRPGYRDVAWLLTRNELDPYYCDANVYGDYGPNNYDDIQYWSRVFYGEPFPHRPNDLLKNAIFHAQENPDITRFQLRWGPMIERAANVVMMFNANVLNIDSGSGGSHVTGLSCATIDQAGEPGKRFRVQGDGAYVLAQGGIESVRLLKLSGNLGDNSKRQLGRGFMVHPLITHAACVTFKLPVPLIIQNFFGGQQVRLKKAIALASEPPVGATPIYHPEPLEEVLVFWAFGALTPTPEAMTRERIGNFRIMPGPSEVRNGTSVVININWEQVPNENSRIDLDPSQTDPVFGQPVVRLDWNLEERDKRTAIRGLALCEEYLRSHGAATFDICTDLSGGPEHWTFEGNERLQPGDHHMGALRMSKQEDDGIVDCNLRMHAVDNLFVSSSAVFPTSGYANPTLTIVALALRLADHLKDNLG